MNSPTTLDAVRGPVLPTDAAGFNAEACGFQTAFTSEAVVAVGAMDVADIRSAVRHASEHGLPVAVHSTGHGAVGSASGSVVINTSRLSTLHIDPHRRTAQVGAGVRWEQVVAAAAEVGLAPLNGSAPGVGAVGYTLGGGLGLLARQYGYTAEHVRSVDLVTADGAFRHVTAESDPDLFFALRGAGANFGVVTGMEIALVPVSRIYGGALMFDAAVVPEILRCYREWTETVPDEMSSAISLIPFPDDPGLPEPMRGRQVVSVHIVYTGAPVDGERLVAPLRAIGPTIADSVTEMPYSDSAAVYDDPTEPHAYRGDNAVLSDVDPGVLESIAEQIRPGRSPMTIFSLRHLGGALQRAAATPSAVGHREAQFVAGVLSPMDGMSAERVEATHSEVLDTFTDVWEGRLLNFIFGHSTRERVRTAFSPADFSRLTRLKSRYDPANMFRHNHNIVPGDG